MYFKAWFFYRKTKNDEISKVSVDIESSGTEDEETIKDDLRNSFLKNNDKPGSLSVIPDRLDLRQSTSCKFQFISYSVEIERPLEAGRKIYFQNDPVWYSLSGMVIIFE